MSEPERKNALDEITDAISSLMMGDDVLDANEQLLADKYVWVAHAVEHLRAAKRLLT